MQLLNRGNSKQRSVKMTKKGKVHKYKNVWWFWDESKKPRQRIGSYTSKVGAQKGRDDWFGMIEENKTESQRKNERIANHSSELIDKSNDKIDSECLQCVA